MSKRRRTRAKEPRYLGDLLPGDRCVIPSEWGELPVRLSWHQGMDTFVRVDIPGVKSRDVVRYSSLTKLIRVTDTMGHNSAQEGKTMDVNDPLTGGR